MPQTSILEDCKDQVIAQYRDGLSMADIAASHGVTPMTVCKSMKRWGEPARQPGDKYKEAVDKAMDLLSQGQSINQVAQQVGVPRSTLSRLVKERGHDSGPLIKRCEVSLKDHAHDIISRYRQGESSGEIARIYGCDPSNIIRLLQAYDVKRRFHYEVDDDFFKVIDTEEKAYTLGFFIADGNNRSSKEVVEIAVCDIDILKKIKMAMKYTGPLLHRDPPKNFPYRQPIARLSVCSKTMCRDLTDKGCPPNKTFISRFPTEDEVPESLLHHYIRGVFDGDGSLFRCDNGWHVAFAGTVALLDPMRHFIHRQVGIMLGMYPHGKIYVAKIGGNCQVPRFMEWLYKDATIYLDRKYDLYKTMLCELSLA